jgi:hypothetical protein
MKMLCDFFNQYRDGVLDPEQTRRFESHLTECNLCRPRLLLLNHVVHAIRNQDMPNPIDPPEKIADRAYEQNGSWDVFLLSWLKPLPAWSGLVALLILIAFLWIAPLAQQPASSNDYEDLMSSDNQAGSAVASLSDAELERWLEQGGALR